MDLTVLVMLMRRITRKLLNSFCNIIVINFNVKRTHVVSIVSLTDNMLRVSFMIALCLTKNTTTIAENFSVGSP